MKNQELSRRGINLSAWAELRPEDFDGHTEFTQMDAEQRLRWLSEIARFVHDARQCQGVDESGHSGD
jgi:hypothetical protein